jgi:uncharacterized protein (TIGR02246 family)
MKKNILGVAFVAMMLIITAAFGASEEEQQVRKTYYQWVHAIETAKGNPNSVVALYSPKAVLLATLSPLPLTTQEDLERYFEKLTANKNLKVETKQMIFQFFPNISILSGVYVFNYTDKNNKPVSLEARFSFVYHESQGKWLIVNHHSSLIPSIPN